MYDPVLGQFTTADPYVSSPAGTGLNRFAYVGNSPLNFVDPSGFDLSDPYEQLALGITVGSGAGVFTYAAASFGSGAASSGAAASGAAASAASAVGSTGQAAATTAATGPSAGLGAVAGPGAAMAQLPSLLNALSAPTTTMVNSIPAAPSVSTRSPASDSAVAPAGKVSSTLGTSPTVEPAPYLQETPSASRIIPEQPPNWGPGDWQDVLRKAKWTDSQRNAAFLWEDSVINQSIRVNREFYTFIVERNGRYAVLPTQFGSRSSSVGAVEYLESFMDAKIRGVRVTAAAHTHGASTSYQNPRLTDDVFSTHRGGDADFARANNLTSYLGTPHGRLLELLPGQTVGTDLGVLPSYGIP